MLKPDITPFKLDKINEPEEFLVFRPCRIALPGKPAKGFKKGVKVVLSGGAKKDLYYQNKIMYESDFEKVVAYEKEMKEKYVASVKSEETAKLSGDNKAVAELKKENASLKKAVDELAAKVAELTPVKK